MFEKKENRSFMEENGNFWIQYYSQYNVTFADQYI